MDKLPACPCHGRLQWSRKGSYMYLASYLWFELPFPAFFSISSSMASHLLVGSTGQAFPSCVEGTGVAMSSRRLSPADSPPAPPSSPSTPPPPPPRGGAMPSPPRSRASTSPTTSPSSSARRPWCISTGSSRAASPTSPPSSRLWSPVAVSRTG